MVVIIGILAAIALPKFATTKERAYVATMQSDLHNLISTQEAYLADNGAYYGGAIPNLAVLPYRPSTGTTVTIVLATASRLAGHRHLGQHHPDLRGVLRRRRAASRRPSWTASRSAPERTSRPRLSA